MPVIIKTVRDDLPDWHKKGKDRVIQNVQNLTALIRYEVAYNRTLGLPPGLTDLPAGELEARYAAELTELIEANEPRAVVQEVSRGATTPDGEITFEVVIDFAD